MKLLLILLLLMTFLTCVKPVKNRKKQYKINEGASTSRASDPVMLTQEEECKIDELLYRRYLLVYGHSTNYDGNLTAYAENYPDELLVIYEENEKIKSEMKRLKVNSGIGRENFEKKLEMKRKESHLRTKRRKHYPNLLYTIDVNNQTITRVHTKERLCESAVAKMELEHFRKEFEEIEVTKDKETCGKKTRPRKLLKPVTRDRSGIKLSHHHIVSAELLRDFFALIPDKLGQRDNSFIETIKDKISDCDKIFLVREDLVKMKLLVGDFIKKKREVAKSGLTLDIDIPKVIEDESYGKELGEKFKCWLTMGENLVVGPEPRSRGPFDPNMRYQRYGFEDRMEPIIGEKHFYIAQKIDEAMKKFVEEHPKMTEDERLKKMDIIMHLISYSSKNFRLTPFNPDQWEKRFPTEADLDQLKDQSLKKVYKNNMYWDIKKPKPESSSTVRPKRSLAIGIEEPFEENLQIELKLDSNISKKSKRSLDIDEHELRSENLATVVRQRWTEFVLDSLKEQIEADYFNQSFEWSDDFKNLYDQYLFDDWTDIMCPNNTSLGFDNFLYARMYFQDGWQDCIDLNNKSHIRTDEEWCLAFRRTVLSSKSPKTRQFLKDRTTVWKKLTQIFALNQVPRMNVMPEAKINILDEYYLDEEAIYFGSVIQSLIQYSHIKVH